MTSEEEPTGGTQATGGDRASENGEGKTPDSPAAPAGGRREHNAATWLAAVALLLALVALAGVGASAWAWYQLRGEQSRLSLLEGRTSALDGRLSALETSAARARDLTALQDRVASLARAAQSRSAAYSARLDDLSSRLASGVTSYREDEAEMLMRLAQSQLAVNGDPGSSAQALTLADQALEALHEPRLAPVRAALAQEIQALNAVPTVDVPGTVARLRAVSQQVDRLPLAGERFTRPSPAAASGAAPAGWSWDKLGAAFKRAFSPLIVVRHGPVARPLLPPREAYFVRENLKLALASAGAALLEHDQASYRASLEQARQWLDTWFDTGARSVSAARATLDRLSGIEINPPLPALGEALSRLRAVRAGAKGS